MGLYGKATTRLASIEYVIIVSVVFVTGGSCAECSLASPESFHVN